MFSTISLRTISILRILCSIVVFLVLAVYHFIFSFVFFFIPRILRKKKNIKGQRVLITGAGSGVGRSMAIEFSKHGTCLILVDINMQSLVETEKLLDRCSQVFIYDCDVSDYKKVYEMAKQVQKDAGDVDILVNNAGIVSGQCLWDLPEQKIIRTMEVNTLAHFWTCKAFLPAMMNKNYGHIVSIISLGGKMGCPKLTDYCASKYAALGFAESLEIELRKNKINGIKITAVCPAIIDTKLFKGARFDVIPSLNPEYVAKEVVAGVLENEEMIFLPRYANLAMMIKDLEPRWIAIIIHKILGSSSLMDNFVGTVHPENGMKVADNGVGTVHPENGMKVADNGVGTIRSENGIKLTDNCLGTVHPKNGIEVTDKAIKKE